LLQNQKLVVTFNTLYELTSTPRLITDFITVKNACKAIFEFADEIITDNYVEYIQRLDGNKNTNPNFGDKLINEVQAIAQYNDVQLKKPEIEIFQELIKERTDANKEVTANVTSLLNPIREREFDKKKHREIGNTEQFLHIMQNFFLNVFINPYINMNTIRDNFPWDEIELFIHTLNALFMELELSKMNIKENDWMDLINLIYVKPGYKYWTSEDKWQNNIIRAQMEHYLFIKK
jgi:hypothetical protein